MVWSVKNETVPSSEHKFEMSDYASQIWICKIVFLVPVPVFENDFISEIELNSLICIRHIAKMVFNFCLICIECISMSIRA
jgi:hypothetical protein